MQEGCDVGRASGFGHAASTDESCYRLSLLILSFAAGGPVVWLNLHTWVFYRDFLQFTTPTHIMSV